MSIWCVKPEDVKLDLKYVSPNGDVYPLWIRVKKALTVGEERRVMTAGWRGMRNGAKGEDAGTEIQIDWKVQTFARAEAYLTDWSLTDDGDVKLPLSRDTIESLNSDVYKVIEDGITAHVEAVLQEKKLKPGAFVQ